MRSFRDPALFGDPLTEALLRTGIAPLGLQWLYRSASVLLDPVTFGEWLAVVLLPLSAWLVFRIVREHTPWGPAAWGAAGLFIFGFDIHPFSGGHGRAFAHPIVLATVYLALRRRDRLAALLPPIGAMLYPPAALSALAIVGLSSLRWERGPRLERGRVVLAACSAAVVAGVVLAPSILGATSPHPLTRAQAIGYPEFRILTAFFGPGTMATLRANFSGFRLLETGSLLAVLGLALLCARPRNARLLRREVWAMAISSVALFGLAHLLLFRLYLPHRYTYPIIPFLAVLAGVAWRPTWEALVGPGSRGRLLAAGALVAAGPVLLALVTFKAFPLVRKSIREAWTPGSWLEGTFAALGVAAVVGLVLAALLARRERSAPRRAGLAAALVAGSLVLGEVGAAGGLRTRSAFSCQQLMDVRVYDHLATLPKDAVIAGDPSSVDCVPLAARRPVVVSRKLYVPWDAAYLRIVRDRTFAAVHAYYGPSLRPLLDLRRAYSADYLVLDRRLLSTLLAWESSRPFTGDLIRNLLLSGDPAVLSIPRECRTWHRGPIEVFDLACVERRARRAMIESEASTGRSQLTPSA